MKNISDIRTGDRVLRYLHVSDLELPPMELFVVGMTDKLILCSVDPHVDLHNLHSTTPIWEFCKTSGQEHDPDLVAIMGAAGTGYTVSHIEPA